MENIINNEKFIKGTWNNRFQRFEEIVLYLLGLILFFNHELIKTLGTTIMVLVFIRAFIFKKKLDCGDEWIKKVLLFYIIVGIFWNFLGGMSYIPARNFFKTNRYIWIVFFIYPLIKTDKKLLKNFMISSLIGYSVFFLKIVWQVFMLKQIPIGFQGIAFARCSAGIVGAYFFGKILIEKTNKKRLLYLVLFLSSIFIIVVTQGRAAMLGLFSSSIIILFISLIMINKKRIIIFLVGISILSVIGIKIIPSSKLNRFKTTFDTQQTIANSSNYLRIEMWKINVFMIKQHPILGQGTKYDKDNLFRKYVEKMPTKTETQRWYKNILLKGFDDAHSIYLNATVDNGIFVICLFIIWFIIPLKMMLKNLKQIGTNKYLLPALAGLGCYLIQGFVWSIWRHPEQIYFWMFFTLMMLSTIDFLKNDVVEENI